MGRPRLSMKKQPGLPRRRMINKAIVASRQRNVQINVKTLTDAQLEELELEVREELAARRLQGSNKQSDVKVVTQSDQPQLKEASGQPGTSADAMQSLKKTGLVSKSTTTRSKQSNKLSDRPGTSAGTTTNGRGFKSYGRKQSEKYSPKIMSKKFSSYYERTLDVELNLNFDESTVRTMVATEMANYGIAPIGSTDNARTPTSPARQDTVKEKSPEVVDTGTFEDTMNTEDTPMEVFEAEQYEATSQRRENSVLVNEIKKPEQNLLPELVDDQLAKAEVPNFVFPNLRAYTEEQVYQFITEQREIIKSFGATIHTLPNINLAVPEIDALVPQTS